MTAVRGKDNQMSATENGRQAGHVGNSGPEGLAGRLAGFRRAEDGSILIFALVMFLTVLVLVGIAVDVIRFEDRRAQAQNTLDRAVLAAADISQTYTAQQVVDDYFAKAGLSDLAPVAHEQKGTYNEWKTVDASLPLRLNTMFIGLAGVDSLHGPVASAAEERIGNVEISLVLDVSGSMGDTVYDNRGRNIGTKLSLLKGAAKNFVDTMFTNVQGSGTDAGKLSITVVPYAQQVTLGSTLAGYFNLTTEHNHGTCVDFFSADFKTAAITPTQELPRTAYADLRNSGSSPSNLGQYECYQTASREVLAFSTDESAIDEMIGNLTSTGDTAIDIGAKWGLAFLDPALRPTVTTMISDSRVDADLAGRPYDYGDPNSLKVLVLMTDGENTNTYALKPAYKSGLSPVYKATSGSASGKYFYYYDRSGTNADYYYYDTSGCSRNCSWTSGFYTASTIGAMTQQSWQQVWTTFGVTWFGKTLYKNATGANSSSFWNNAVVHTSYGTKDDQLRDVCAAAKAENVLVFTIGFDASDAGEAVMRSCASADSYYYDAQGKGIEDAFAGIANAITMLRLTQ